MAHTTSSPTPSAAPSETAAESGCHIERNIEPPAVDGATLPPGGDAAFELQIASTGRIVLVDAGQSVVDALSAAGITIATSCGQGLCGTCLTRVLAGEIEHRDQYLDPDEQAAMDQFLPCCSRARSPRLVLDL